MNPELSQSGDFKFPGQEKLKHRKAIQSLFEQGKSAVYSPLRVVYIIKNEEHSVPKFAVSVPKRLFPSAVDRNKIKRKIREGYRLNKKPLLDQCKVSNVSLHMMWICIKPGKLKYKEIEIASQKIISKLIKATPQPINN